MPDNSSLLQTLAAKQSEIRLISQELSEGVMSLIDCQKYWWYFKNRT